MTKLMFQEIDRRIADGEAHALLRDPVSPTMKKIIQSRISLLRVRKESQSSRRAARSSAREGARLKDRDRAPAISVIVPVYNTQPYLPRCLESILCQTFTNFEVICVDDCSQDESWQVLQHYAARDDRVRIVKHETNVGAGGARNTAIDLARGEYIAGVDSDDYVAPEMLEALYAAAIRDEACIVVCGFRQVDQDGHCLKVKKQRPRVLHNADDSLDIFSTCNPAVWNKLWKRSLFVDNGIYFPTEVFYQDLATTPRLLTKARTVSFIKASPYFYVLRDGSTTYSNTAKHIVDYFKVFGFLRNFLIENGLLEKHERGFVTALKRACRFRAENIIAAEIDETEKIGFLTYMAAIYKHFSNLAPLTDRFSAEDYLDFIANGGTRCLPISVSVKTLYRPIPLERLLRSIGEYQKAHSVRFREVIVGDDSPSAAQDLNRKVIDSVRADYPDLQVNHLRFDYDIGCSAGRNAVIESAQSEYILQCDDDFMLDSSCDIEAALNLFTSKGVDILGGWLKDKYDTATGEFEYRAAIGFFTEDDENLAVDICEDKYKTPEYVECHFIMNFFIAKRESLLKCPWDSALKTEEHHEFFYRAQKLGMKTAFSKKLFAQHTHEKVRNPAEYKEHRFEKERWERFLFLSVEKCGKKRRVVTTTSHDRRIVWDVDRIRATSIERVVALEEGVEGQAALP